MTKTPKVSVLTPIYNTKPQHLREMIESILNQTFTDFEFLILNDSPDNTEIENIVLEYAKHDKRVKYFKNDKNMGITPSRNKLVDLSRGEYLAIFDHDDISVPERLAREVEYLDTHPHVGVVSGWLQYFGDNNIWKTPEYDLDIKKKMTSSCCVWHTAAMVRKSVLVDNNVKYNEYYSPCEDFALWADLMGITHFHNLPETLVKYRCFANNTSHNQSERLTRASNELLLYIKNKYSAYATEYLKQDNAHTTVFRLRLFGIIPLVKIKNNWVLLFECLPVFKLGWR